VALAVVHDLREARASAGPDELAAFETDTLAGLVLARAAAGLADSTIAGEVIHLEQVRAWLGQPLWTMQPADADDYFGQVLRGAARGTRLARAQALKTYFLFLELRHKVEIHQMTGHVVACPVDEVNRPRGGQDAALRIPPSEAQVGMLFAGWRGELAECRKFAPAARNYAAARLMAETGLRVNEACQLDLGDVKWDLGRFGKIHVRMGKGARGSGPRERMVPLINNARATLEWFVQDVWGHFDDDHARPGAPLLPSERRNPDGTCARVGGEALRAALAAAAAAHLPDWRGRVTPHLLRHYCASQLYANGMDLAAIQEVLGHSWVVTTMNYIHVHRTHVEDAWIVGQQRAAGKLNGLLPSPPAPLLPEIPPHLRRKGER
jgi:integrase/recombinase XerD